MAVGRRGDWIQTYTGRKFYPLDPRPEDVCIEDIAHALSNVCRFAGHVREFYSVAQHSVLVSSFAEGPAALWFLLHDAPEAYLGDITRPLKRDLTALGRPVHEVEDGLMVVVAEAMGLPPGCDWDAVKRADDAVLATEARDLMSPLHPEWSWVLDAVKMSEPIVPVPPGVAKQQFLARYYELKGAPQ